MKCYLAFAILILTASLAGQVEHAPTVAQCQADQRLWFAQIEADTDASKSILPTYDVMSAWSVEMLDCRDVDPDNKIMYSNTHREITVERMLRLQHYLDRHQLWDKFKAEDAAGK